MSGAKQAVRSLLLRLGLAPAGDAARAKANVERLKRDAESKARKLRANAATIADFQAQQDATRLLQIVEHAERSTLKKALAYHWDELHRLETIYGPYQQRILLQLAVAIRASRASAGAEPTGRHPAAAAGLSRVPVGNTSWTLPTPPGGEAAEGLALEQVLPLAELATLRQFTVGGVMLDLGAGPGLHALPRVLLGDADRAWATEADAAGFGCLAENVHNSGLDRAVVAERVAVGHEAAAPADVPRLPLDAWMTRAGVPRGDVRFVRIALGAAGLGVLKEGLALLPGRDLVWQLELDVERLRASREAVQEVAAVLAAHFTHFKELGVHPAEPWRRAPEAKRLFKNLADPGPTSLLLFNLR